MSIAWSDVEAIAPELSSVAAASQTAILAIVNRQISDTQWGALADDGRRFLAAHYGTLNLSENGGSAMVTSETLGPMSRTYAVSSSSSTSGTSTTGWGREYERLLKIAVPRFLVTP